MPLWFVTIAFVSRTTRSRCFLSEGAADLRGCNDEILSLMGSSLGCCVGHVTQVAVACLRTGGVFSEKVSCVDGEPASSLVSLDVEDNSQLAVSRNLDVFNSITTSGNDNVNGNDFPTPGVIQLLQRTNFSSVTVPGNYFESANAPCECNARLFVNPNFPPFPFVGLNGDGCNNFRELVFKDLTDVASFSLTAT